MVKLIQPSMAGGEVSPEVSARVDLAKRSVAVELAENFIAQYTGGMDSRAGQKFVARAKAAERIIEFEFNTEQTYIIEMGDQYLRFHRNGGQILDSSNIQVITGATQADPVVVTSTAHGFSNGDEVFISGIGGMTQLNNRSLLVANVTANTFELQTLDGVDVDGTSYDAFSSNGTAIPPYEITTPWAAADIMDIRYAQSADVMTLVHPSYPPQDLTRLDNDSWTLTETPFEPEIGYDDNLSITVGTTGSEDQEYVVTAVALDGGEESLPFLSGTALTITGATQADPVVVTTSAAHGLVAGDEIEINSVVGMTELNGERFIVKSAPSTTTIELRTLGLIDVDGTGYTAYVSGGEVRPAFIRISNGNTSRDNDLSWDAVDGAELYKVYFSTNGIFDLIASTPLTEFKDASSLGLQLGDTPPRFRNPFQQGTNYYPATIGFFEQRKIYGNTNTNPNRIFASQLANFNNFAVSSPAQDDDAIIATIAARRINAIQHILPLSDLIVMTTGGEYRGFSETGVITPSTLNLKPQTYYGSTSLRPIVAGDVGLFITPGQDIRDFSYSFADDKFKGRNVTLLARHLFRFRTIVDWDFSPAPYSVAYCIRDDGRMLALTYQPDEDVYGWTQAVTKGLYKSVAVIREGDYDAPYFLVERTINGNTVRFIERLDKREFVDIEDAFCVDAGLQLDTPITATGYTAADPVVITAPAHGLSNGDVVDLSDFYQVDTSETSGEALNTTLNGTGYTVANVTTNTFELQNAGAAFDGSALAAYSSGGVVRKAVTTVGGLWHLEGETVVVAANGYATTGVTVTNGQITLGSPASRVSVGLGYLCRLITLPLSSYSAGGQTIQGQAKNINRLTVQVLRSLGMWFGPSTGDLMREAKFGAPTRYGQPLSQRTEDIDVTMKASWGKKKQVVIEQRLPLPLSVLALVPDASVGGN